MRPLFALAVLSRDDNFVLLLCLIGSGGGDVSEINIDQSRSRDGINDKPSQAEAQTRGCFFTNVVIALT